MPGAETIAFPNSAAEFNCPDPPTLAGVLRPLMVFLDMDLVHGQNVFLRIKILISSILDLYFCRGSQHAWAL